MAEQDEGRQGGAALIRMAAAEVLLEVGLQGATTRLVTDRAGVGRGLLNHYFRWPTLRADTWEALFAEATAGQFATDLPPDSALEAYLASAFATEAEVYWRLWLEATDLAGTDPEMATALRRVQGRMLAAMAVCLARGAVLALWKIPDASGTALRLTALHDGLAGLLLAGTTGLTPTAAEAHLRRSFALEAGWA